VCEVLPGVSFQSCETKSVIEIRQLSTSLLCGFQLNFMATRTDWGVYFSRDLHVDFSLGVIRAEQKLCDIHEAEV